VSAARALGWLGVLLTLTGCSAFNYVAPDRPLAQAAVPPMLPRPQVALVLGSGGPRGYAHIGVLQVLEDAGIAVDLVVGSSVGSLIGAFWADGLSAARIDEIARSGGPLTLFDLSPFADRGWIHGQRLQDYVNDNLGHQSIEQLPRRLVVAATRRADKVPVFFQTGNIGVAVRASSAVPRIISPVGVDGIEYEDADESLPLAVRAARQAGAQFVIAIDVSARPGTAPSGTSRAMLDRDATRRSRIDPEVADADFLIHPDMPYTAGPNRAYFVSAQAAGVAAAQQALPALMARLRGTPHADAR
jgi:NTE family protein